ncbi:hypothetical protein TrLO_g9485 [Triparma laevis f. longispina]|uniref:Uncharacterized protein n=1 Tax=Triparma laevis f. longispina TaxID=1714387 RepID=A0A9W7EH76_9STRA|nr:hypothetical protein TrLO_g9485 [Triparma laevis f. longispina]
MPLSDADQDLLKKDLKKNPNCIHSTMSSTQMSWINGKSESSKTLKVYRRCQDPSRNSIVIERTSKGDGSSMLSGMNKNMNSKADELLSFLGSGLGIRSMKRNKEEEERVAEAVQRQNSNPFNPKPNYRYSPD